MFSYHFVIISIEMASYWQYNNAKGTFVLTVMFRGLFFSFARTCMKDFPYKEYLELLLLNTEKHDICYIV